MARGDGGGRWAPAAEEARFGGVQPESRIDAAATRKPAEHQARARRCEQQTAALGPQQPEGGQCRAAGKRGEPLVVADVDAASGSAGGAFVVNLILGVPRCFKLIAQNMLTLFVSL